MESRHKYTRETEANELRPKPQAQLSKNKLVKDKLNTNFIAETISLHIHESHKIILQELRVS